MIIPQVQITLGCNLACRYCFQDHDNAKIMDHLTLYNIIDKSVKYNKNIPSADSSLEILWHGGEPLLAGLDFLKKIVEFESKYPLIKFVNKIQTNAIAMTEEIAEFLVKHDFNVGFSIDGPETTHDHHRLLKNQKPGAFRQTMKGVELYKKYSRSPFIPVIAVVTKHTVQKGAKEFYEFFKELRSCIQLDPYDITCWDLAKNNLNIKNNPFIPDPQEYGNFIKDLFNLWFYDEPGNVDIRELKNEIKLMLCPEVRMEVVENKKRCSEFRTIFDPSGNVYSCDQYVNTETASLGNINAEPLEIIMNRKYDLWEKIKKAFRSPENNYLCKSCEYGKMCSGGCLTCMKYNSLILKGYSIGNLPPVGSFDQISENFPETGDSIYCRSYKIYRKHIEKCVNEEMTVDSEKH